MNTSNGLRIGYGTMVICIACLTGCEHSKYVTRAQSLLPGRTATVGNLSPHQTSDMQVALGRVMEKEGRLEQAMAAYRAALMHDLDRADACWRLAVVSDRLGKFDDSEEFFRKALEKDPDNPDIYCDMGYSLYLQRRWPEAEKNLRQATALEPDHARAHNNLGLVLAHTDRLPAALAEFRKGGCSEADAHANLAFVLSLDGRWDEAQDQYHEALASDPASQRARKRLQELDSLIPKVRLTRISI